MSVEGCMYGRSAAAVGSCSGTLSWIVPGYFANGTPARFCAHHGGRWNALHPMGPVATKMKAPRAVRAKVERTGVRLDVRCTICGRLNPFGQGCACQP